MSQLDMQRETSPTISPKSHSTSLTTPDQSPGNDDDIWASDSEDGNLNNNDATNRRRELLSDLPSVKRQHMNNGYREGLAIGKAQVMQQGFDKGYPIGVTIALRAGKIIGILEGYVASKPLSLPDHKDKLAALQKLLDQAKEELACTALLKDISDEMVANADDVPDHIEQVIRKWELRVLGK